MRGGPRAGPWADFKEEKEGKEAKKGKTTTIRKRGVAGGPYGRPLRRMKTLCNLRRFLILRKERKERKPRKEKKGAPAKAV